jgi:hypothetical protein
MYLVYDAFDELTAAKICEFFGLGKSNPAQSGLLEMEYDGLY